MKEVLGNLVDISVDKPDISVDKPDISVDKAVSAILVVSKPLNLDSGDQNFNCMEPTYGCSGDCSCDGDK